MNNNQDDSIARRLNRPFVDEIAEQTDQQDLDRHHLTP